MLVGLRQLPPGCRVLDASNPALSMHLRQIDDALSYLVPVGPLLVHHSWSPTFGNRFTPDLYAKVV